VWDFTSGYRAYRASVLKQAYAQYGDKLVDQDGFQCMVDILLKLRTMPLIFGEVPMILRYDLKRGPSKMRLIKTAAATLRLLCARRFGRGMQPRQVCAAGRTVCKKWPSFAQPIFFHCSIEIPAEGSIVRFDLK